MDELNLTILNRYDLLAPSKEFEAAIGALASRVYREGHSGVLSYRFFVNANDQDARAVIEYADADAWIGHHETSMNWKEMKNLHAAAKLVEVTFLGHVTAEIRSWISNSSLTATVLEGNDYVAGFRR